MNVLPSVKTSSASKYSAKEPLIGRSIAAWLLDATQELQVSGSSTPRLDALSLLGLVTQHSKATILAHGSDSLSPVELRRLQTLLGRRLSGEPMAYLRGTADFYGHTFTVNRHVLVPRPESESFLSLLMALRKKEKLHTLIDIGTGSGALAIACKLTWPDLYVTATDSSLRALSVAAQNSLALRASVTLRRQSILTDDKEGYDVVLANLPYVPTAAPADPSIVHEPRQALFSGPDGLGHYRRLFRQLRPKHIRFVLIESLPNQHAPITNFGRAAGYRLSTTEGLVQLFVKNT